MSQTSLKPSLLNEHDVADRLGLSVRTIRKWRLIGSGPAFVKLGRAVRYQPDVVEAFIADGRRDSTSQAAAA